MSPTADERQFEEGQERTHKAPIPEEGDEIGTAERPRRTTSKRITNPRLEIGSESFTENQIVSAHILTHSDDQAEFRSASVILNPPIKRRWDYHGEVRIHEDNDLLLTGICTEAKLEEGGRLHLKLRGPFWRLERTALQGVGTFGMSNKETFYWLAKLTNPRGDSVVEGLQLNDTFRPFIFAVPLKNLKSSGKGLLHLSTDAGIASHDYETTFKPILALFKEIAEEPAWNDENPKLFGVVFGENLLKADRAARERAEFLVGIMNLALRTGMSHFETRYGADPIAFDADTTISPVSFHPWVIIREAAEVKGWVRRIPTAKLESEISLDGSLDRIGFFLKRFNEASSSGDVHVQLGRRQLTARERKLSLGVSRALRWLNTASREEDMPDRFAATWVALESILNSISYPGVFKGERAKLREEIRGKVRQIGLPKTTRESLSITTDMLENRILQDNWSLARKLRIFAESLGIQLNPNDRQLVGKLSEARNTIFHEGDGSPELSQEQVDQLQYLVERLIVAVSIGGYEDLEDGIHQFHLGTIGPEGGAAPISINGKEDIPYQLIGTMNDQGELVTEWIVEGKIYPHKNIVFVRPDHNQET